LRRAATAAALLLRGAAARESDAQALHEPFFSDFQNDFRAFCPFF
jgi:hypothetical protein